MTAARDVMGEYARLHGEFPDLAPKGLTFADGAWWHELVTYRGECLVPLDAPIALALCRSRLVEWLDAKYDLMFDKGSGEHQIWNVLDTHDFERRLLGSDANFDLALIAAARAGGGR